MGKPAQKKREKKKKEREKRAGKKSGKKGGKKERERAQDEAERTSREAAAAGARRQLKASVQEAPGARERPEHPRGPALRLYPPQGT